MAIDERSRHALYQRLEQVLGTADADTMMELLPPVGWADVATKHDIDALRVATTQDIDATRHDIDALDEKFGLRLESMASSIRAELADRLRQQLLVLVPLMVAINGIGVALAALRR